MPGQEEKRSFMNSNLANAYTAPTPSNTATSPIAYPPQRSDAPIVAVNDSRWGSGLRTVRSAALRVVNSIRSLGPYVAIELILPGGTIIALALWAYRRRTASRAAAKATSTDVSPVVRPLRCLGRPCTQA